MKKRMLALLLTGIMAMTMVACGTDADETTDAEGQGTEAGTEEAVDLGTPLEVLDSIYATAELDAELKDQIDNGGFQQAELDETIAAMFLGETQVDYVSGAGSAPMMSSIAYQVVVLEVADGQDIEATKTELVETADIMKWVCVQPEAVVAESNGNYILFVMADTATADALVAAFNAL